MKDEQNQFYTSISKYYSEIFPYQPMQLQFVKNRAGELTGKQILDIGCATGELAFQMAKEGAKVIGIDLNEDLLSQATGFSGFSARWSGGQSAVSNKSESEYTPPKFQAGNMLNLKSDFQPSQFDAVLCFGNTLVHLQTTELIQQMLNGVYSVLKPGGQFMMQILNYDYVLGAQLTELPLIETENIRFIRKYHFEENNPIIRFQTQLEIKKEDIIVSNETSLFALKSAELISLLKTSGFKEIELFSNFKQDDFGGKNLPLVVSCMK
jgi:2-polyprenyl-3-methyl-5-hydroxy-6-metoxy-1,4-benzoquinol methylase